MASDEPNGNKQTSEPPLPKLALPAATVEAIHIVRRIRSIGTWVERIARRGIPMPPSAFSAVLLRRFDIQYAPGARAMDFARRLLPDPLALGDTELTVSPYAPPMRQLSSVRQGVPMWRAGSAPPGVPGGQFVAKARPAAPTAPPVPPSASHGAQQKKELPPDLVAILNLQRALGRSE